MNIISIDDINSQAFSFNMDSYSAYIIISKPPIRRDYGYGVMDLFVDGYGDIFGIPMVEGVDLIADYVKSGCLPVDIGAFYVISGDNMGSNVSDIASGYAMLMYLTGPETVAAGMFS